MVTLEEMRESYARRARERAAEASSEAERIRSLLPKVARHLRELGASEVWVFGSLVQGRFHAESDVDIATSGLGFHDALKAVATCGDLLDRSVDVVRLEDAPPTLAARVRETGSRLP